MDTSLSTHVYCVYVYSEKEWAAIDCKKQHEAGDNLDGFGGTSIGGPYTTNGFLYGTKVEGYALFSRFVFISLSISLLAS